MTSPKTPLRVRYYALDVKYSLLYVPHSLLCQRHQGTRHLGRPSYAYRLAIFFRRTYRGRRVLILNSGFFFSSAATLTVYRLILR
jgi:hypothetical protein